MSFKHAWYCCHVSEEQHLVILGSTWVIWQKNQWSVFYLMKCKPLRFLCSVILHLCVFCNFLFSLCTVVHRSLYSAKQTRPGKQRSTSSTQHQQQSVVRQRLEHAELCGFKPIDSPATAVTSGSSRKQTTARSSHKASSESSSNPLSGEEYYWTDLSHVHYICRLLVADLSSSLLISPCELKIPQELYVCIVYQCSVWYWTRLQCVAVVVDVQALSGIFFS